MVNIDSSYLRLPRRASIKYVWTTSSGEKIRIVDMTLSHINNLINCFTQKSKNYNFSSSKYYSGHKGSFWIKELTKERAYRLKVMSSLK